MYFVRLLCVMHISKHVCWKIPIHISPASSPRTKILKLPFSITKKLKLLIADTTFKQLCTTLSSFCSVHSLSSSSSFDDPLRDFLKSSERTQRNWFNLLNLPSRLTKEISTRVPIFRCFWKLLYMWLYIDVSALIIAELYTYFTVYNMTRTKMSWCVCLLFWILLEQWMNGIDIQQWWQAGHSFRSRGIVSSGVEQDVKRSWTLLVFQSRPSFELLDICVLEFKPVFTWKYNIHFWESFQGSIPFMFFKRINATHHIILKTVCCMEWWSLFPSRGPPIQFDITKPI
jgi:hypothetical protein